jgi:predicted RNA-binding protein with PIN domain
MKVIIDGYNLFKRVAGSSQVSQRQLAMLLQQVQRYARLKKHEILVVFDGGLMPWASSEQRDEHFTIVYAGSGLTADQYIMTYLQEHKQRPIVVVSSDRQIQRDAQHEKADVVETAVFWALVRQTLEKPEGKKAVTPILKTTEARHEELDKLMSQASMFFKREDEEPRSGRAQRISKKERAYKQILKKL